MARAGIETRAIDDHDARVPLERYRALMARMLGMSRQTLYRALKTEGVTYEAVLDALRLRMSLQFLHGPRTSVRSGVAPEPMIAPA